MNGATKALIGLAVIITLIRVAALLTGLVFLNIAAWQWNSDWVDPALLLIGVYIAGHYLLVFMSRVKLR